jgi:hypothetical protein
MTFVDQFNTKADILMERLEKFADSKTIINLFTEINNATLDAIAQVFKNNLIRKSIYDSEKNTNFY